MTESSLSLAFHRFDWFFGLFLFIWFVEKTLFTSLYWWQRFPDFWIPQTPHKPSTTNAHIHLYLTDCYPRIIFFFFSLRFFLSKWKKILVSFSTRGHYELRLTSTFFHYFHFDVRPPPSTPFIISKYNFNQEHYIHDIEPTKLLLASNFVFSALNFSLD